MLGFSPRIIPSPPLRRRRRREYDGVFSANSHLRLRLVVSLALALAHALNGPLNGP